MMGYHSAVLLHESIQGLAIQSDGVYVDSTFGGGGHAKAILSQLGDRGKLFAFDRDAAAHENKFADERLVLIHQNFKYLQRMLRANGIDSVDGILADLGVSSHQFDRGERGFSTRFDAPLDMRMDTSANHCAYEVVNGYTEAQLQHIFRSYGELRPARALARQIVTVRSRGAIETTFQLEEALRRFAPQTRAHRFYAQVFQAIRIEVNGELESLKQMLAQALQLLKTGGRLVVISYHSLEDRLVKRFLKAGNFDGVPIKDFYGGIYHPFKRVNRRVIKPSIGELKENNRARSAKLRIAEKQ